MKHKLLIASALLACCLSTQASTVDWLSVNFGGDSGYGNGWLVALYKDVDKDGWDASTISLIDGSTDSDDVYLGMTTTLFSGTGYEQWATSFSAPAGALATSDNIVSVLFNASTLSGASLYKYDTAFTGGSVGPGGAYQLPATDVPANYTVTQLSSWQAVPEPATAMLLALGGGLAWLVRLKQRLC